MKMDVTLLFSTEDGLVRLETDFASLFANSRLGGVQQNGYFNDLYGNGGPATVGAEFKTNANSEIALAGITVLKSAVGSANGSTLQSPAADDSVLRAVEKIGTGFDNPMDSFGAAAGSQIRVTETLHSTSASTLQGQLVYLVQSTGEGEMTAGVAGELNRQCVECQEPETSGKGCIEDLQLLTGLPMGAGLETLNAGFQRLDIHIDLSGQYSAAFQAVIKPPQ